MTLGALSWLIAALSLTGTVLNIQKRSECFYLWGLSNAAWVFIDLKKGLHAQALLFAIYFVLAVYGAWSWGRGRRERFGHIEI